MMNEYLLYVLLEALPLLTIVAPFLKNNFCPSVYIKFNICFVKLMLEETSKITKGIRLFAFFN